MSEKMAVSRAFAEMLRLVLDQPPEMFPALHEARMVGRRGRPRTAAPGKVTLDANPHLNRIELAARLGLKYDTFLKRLNGETAFKIDDVRAILRLVPDIRLMATLLETTPYAPAERIALPDGEFDSYAEAMLHVVHHLASLSQEIERALRDRHVSDHDRTAIRHELMEAESALASVRALVEGAAHRAF